MNEGNRLIHGHELRDMMLSEDNYDDPRVRWRQESLNQLGMDASALYFNTVGERIMSNGSIVGLPRIDGASSAGTEYTVVWQRRLLR